MFPCQLACSVNEKSWLEEGIRAAGAHVGRKETEPGDKAHRDVRDRQGPLPLWLDCQSLPGASFLEVLGVPK